MEITEIMIDLAFLMPFFWHSKSFQHLKSPSRCVNVLWGLPVRLCAVAICHRARNGECFSSNGRGHVLRWMSISQGRFVIDLIYRNLPLLGETIQLDSYLLNGLQILSISLSLIVAILFLLTGIHHIISTVVSFTAIMTHVLVSPVAFYYQYHLSSLCRIKKSHCLYPLISSKQKISTFFQFSDWPWLLKVKHLDIGSGSHLFLVENIFRKQRRHSWI